MGILSSESPSAGDVTGVPTAQCVDAAQMQRHASADDCWVGINGRVYDLTAWTATHPGGSDAITRSCGADVSAAWMAMPQHNGQDPATRGTDVGAMGCPS